MSTVANVASNHAIVGSLFRVGNRIRSTFHKVHIWFKRYSSFRISDSENNWQTIKCVKVTLRSLYSEIYPPHRDNLYQQTGSGPSSGRAGLLENISSQLINYDTFLYFIYCLWPAPAAPLSTAPASFCKPFDGLNTHHTQNKCHKSWFCRDITLATSIHLFQQSWVWEKFFRYLPKIQNIYFEYLKIE